MSDESRKVFEGLQSAGRIKEIILRHLQTQPEPEEGRAWGSAATAAMARRLIANEIVCRAVDFQANTAEIERRLKAEPSLKDLPLSTNLLLTAEHDSATRMLGDLLAHLRDKALEKVRQSPPSPASSAPGDRSSSPESEEEG